jgi:hypothetical protein
MLKKKICYALDEAGRAVLSALLDCAERLGLTVNQTYPSYDTAKQTSAELGSALRLPAGKTLFKTFLISFIIFAVSLTCTVTKITCFIHWQGAGISSAILGLLCFINKEAGRK